MRLPKACAFLLAHSSLWLTCDESCEQLGVAKAKEEDKNAQHVLTL